MQGEETHYLNTDLYLVAPCDLSPLAQAMLQRGLPALHVSQEENKGSWSARFETEVPFRDPDQNIAAILTAVENLDDAARSLWETCTTREFDIGYDCGDKPWAFNQQIMTATIARIAAAGASIVITLYPAKLNDVR